jgi:hypothetical protein
MKLIDDGDNKNVSPSHLTKIGQKLLRFHLPSDEQRLEQDS